MESWRERGFVPDSDSDSDDGFDSQDTTGIHDIGSKEEAFTAENHTEQAGDAVQDEGPKEDPSPQDVDNNDPSTSTLVRDDHSAVSVQDTALENPPSTPLAPARGDGEEVKDTAQSEEETPTPKPTLRDSEPRQPDSSKEDTNAKDPVTDNEEKEKQVESLPSQELAATPEASSPTTPRAKPQKDIWDLPSSSPDELQADYHPFLRRNATLSPGARGDNQLPEGDNDNEDEDISPLSSPPASLRSFQLDDGIDQEEQARQADRDSQDVQIEQDGADDQLMQNLDDLVNPLDIPEDILQELSQPMRRSLRQRNPIQLHPYLLEDAKYQRLMKARGIKPVRVAQYQEALRAAAAKAANESQGREFVDDAEPPSSSPMPELNFPPSSPAELQLPEKRLHKNSPQLRDQQVPHPKGHSPDGTRAPKRRKVSAPNREDPPRPRYLTQPTVVINNPPMPLEDNSIYDNPSSPPRPETRTFNGFRFPRGFTPPAALYESSATPRNETREPSDTRSTTSEGQDQPDEAHPDEEDEDDAGKEAEEEEKEVPQDDSAFRREKRRIKGVLPASWLRLDQQKQQEGRLSSTQQNHEKLKRAENAKGVAKKLSRKNGAASGSNPGGRLASLQYLADSDASDESGNDEGESTPNARQLLANIVGFEDPFQGEDDGDDILEDNRIDYMFPSATRSHSATPRRKNHDKKRPRLEAKGIHSGNHPKRPRLKKQSRLTDSVNPVQRERKTPRPAAPHRLGVLDAPDVAAQPRSQQPQFLRVAARKARSRQDRGRRSPSRKVFKLSSRLDTEDANTSLHKWRAGQLRQAKLPRPQTAPRRRQPLTDLPTNRRRDFDDGQEPRHTSRNGLHDVGPESRPGENDDTSGDPLNPDGSARSSTPKIETAAKSKKNAQQGNKWVVQRNMPISSLRRNAPRPAVPEMISLSSNKVARRPIQRAISPLGLGIRQKLVPKIKPRNIVMDRFLTDVATPVPANLRQALPAQTSAQPYDKLGNRLQGPRRQLKKRPPKRLDISAAENQETFASVASDVEPIGAEAGVLQTSIRSFGGLKGFTSTYSIEFKISPLCTGAFFHESTFIGSGEFARSLEVSKRDLDQDVGLTLVKIADKNYRWGPWNDSVSSEIGLAFENITGDVEKNDVSEPNAQATPNYSCTIYRSLIKYITEGLTFIDPIDREGFVKRAYDLASKLNDSIMSLNSTTLRDLQHVAQIAYYNLVFTNQTFQIACHSLVSDITANEVLELVKSTSRQVIILISSPPGQADIRRFLEENQKLELRDAGIKEGHSAVDAYVIAQKTLQSTDKLKGCFGDLVTEVYSNPQAQDPDTSKEIKILEDGWHRVFTTLPLNEFDVSGIARVGSRFREHHDQWTIIKQLLQPVLDSFDSNSPSPVSYNNYCRTLFHRCFHLIYGWGWRDCKPILDTLYDFFARNTLYNLKQEENYRSPAFLDELDRSPAIEVRLGDPCFHIFLKIIASGLRFLSKAYEKKKVRNFAWRLLPNHGRTYPKEKPMQQTDLDALRNHHDLLCTLYFAVPDGCRPRLETIKDLVDPATSHRETCNISLRSWTRLARFKLSTDEDVSGLEPFADWHCYFVSELLKQHNLARREVEAQNTGENQFSPQLIERTISQNQRQIESLLKTALGGLQTAIQLAPTIEHAEKLVYKTPIKAVLGLFNSKVARVNTTVSEALQVIMAYTRKCNSVSAPEAQVAATADEDSQDYGDWAGFDVICQDEAPATGPKGIELVEKNFHPAVSRLVSNCFGEDHCPEDEILLSVVDCWTSVAQTLVTHRMRHWDSYLSPYGGESWAALRSTMQTRKFTPKFLASCIEKDARFASECKVQVFGMWMSSLVERDSMLKFQHSLTEALLNQDPTNPMLQNLPFSRDRTEGGQYSIPLDHLKQRRLSLISSLLSNMREHLQDLEYQTNQDSVKQEYRELVQQMMASMKANYQELGSGGASAQGAYVEFVHSIVAFLQQHTREICPVDPFFEDTTSFPLPSNDPTYIVAKLKSYEPKLSSEKVAKTLIGFIQGVSERAAVDGQQVYLVNQLYTSMADTYEAGNPDRPTLRAILLQAVFPAYLETVFTNPTAWILCRPIIQTISRTFKDLLFSMDATDTSSLSSMSNILATVFKSTYKALTSTLHNANTLTNPPAIITIASLISAITSSLQTTDYLDRPQETPNLISQLRAFHAFTHLTTSLLHDTPEDPPETITPLPQVSDIFPPNPTTPQTTPPFFTEIHRAATRELKAYLSESWSQHQGKYYFTRRGGHQPQEVKIEADLAGDFDPESAVKVFDHAAGQFWAACRRLELFEDLVPEQPTSGLVGEDGDLYDLIF